MINNNTIIYYIIYHIISYTSFELIAYLRLEIIYFIIPESGNTIRDVRTFYDFVVCFNAAISAGARELDSRPK